jgi:DNA invertase Pin-like site-specific DNA recombinase
MITICPACRGMIDVVLAKKRNRLFRSRLYRLLWDQDLGELGVKLIALDDTGNRFGDAIQDEFSEWEREEIARRTQDGSWRSAGVASS